MSAESVMFEQLAQAIKAADISQIKALFNQARIGLNSDALLSQVDGDGDTLLHLLLKTGSQEVLNAAKKSYEVGFWQSLAISNSAGEMPLDILKALPSENQAFKQYANEYFSPTFSQSWILKQFRQYLNFQHERDPESYKLEDINAIIQNLYTGHCSGLAALWGQGCLEDGKPDQEYVDSLKKIVYWDVKKESLTPELVKNFERAISLARFYQFDTPKEYLFNTVIAKGHPERIQWKKDQQDHRQPEEFLSAKQNSWSLLLDKDKYQDEGNLEIKRLRQDMFKEFMAEFSVPENDGKVARLTANQHVISFFYKDNAFHVFNSNYRGGTDQKDVFQGVSTHFPINTPADYELVAREIQKTLYDYFGKNAQYVDYGIGFIDKKGKPFGVYPDVDLLMAKSIYKDIMSNPDKVFVPSDFINQVKLLESKLSPEQMKEIYQNVRLDPLKINEIYSKGWDDFSPLVEGIKTENAGLVKCLLQRGADINLEVESKSPLMWAQDMGNKKIIKLIEKGPASQSGMAQSPQALLFSDDLKHNHKAIQHGLEKGAQVEANATRKLGK